MPKVNLPPPFLQFRILVLGGDVVYIVAERADKLFGNNKNKMDARHIGGGEARSEVTANLAETAHRAQFREVNYYILHTSESQ